MIARVLVSEGYDVDAQKLDTMFGMIDFDGGGAIDIEEFFYGMEQLFEGMKPVNISRLRYETRRSHEEFRASSERLDEKVETHRKSQELQKGQLGRNTNNHGWTLFGVGRNPSDKIRGAGLGSGPLKL